MAQQLGVFAPAGEIPLTVGAMFGAGAAPRPFALQSDPSTNYSTEHVGGFPAVTGGAGPASAPLVHDAGPKSLLDLSHPGPTLVLLAVALFALLHFDVGGSVRVRKG